MEEGAGGRALFMTAFEPPGGQNFFSTQCADSGCTL